MRISSDSYQIANIAPAFHGIGTAGIAGSNLNIGSTLLNIGVGQIGNGGSVDSGGGGGGTSGGGGSGGHSPNGGGGMGGSGGTGGMAGGAGSVGGQGPHDTCKKTTPPPTADADDSLEPPNPSPNGHSSGNGDGSDPPALTPMTEAQINPCLGGPPTTKKPRGLPPCKT